MPGGRQLIDQLVDLDLGADVDAARRLVEDQHLGVGQQPLPDDDLLLVSPRKRADVLAEARHPYAQLLGDPGGGHALPLEVHESATRGRTQCDQPEVLLHGGVEHQPLPLAVLGYEPDPGAHGGVHVALPQPLAAHRDAPGVVGVGAEDRAYDLGASGADEPGESDDLTGAHVEADVVEHAVTSQPAHGEQRLPRLWAFARVLLLDAAPDHQPYELVLGRGGGHLADAATVAQNGDPVAEGRDLLQVMGNEDNTHPVRAQLPHDPEELVHFLAGQYGSRLVHDQDTRLKTQRLGDLHHLEPRDAEFAHQDFRRDVHAHTAQQLFRVGLHPLAVDHPEAPGLTAEKDVLGDGQPGHQIELLINGGDTQPLGVLRTVNADFLPCHEDPAAVGPVGTGQHLDQRALSGAVLTEQHMHFTAPQVEVDGVERDDAGEGFAYAFDAQQLVLAAHRLLL